MDKASDFGSEDCRFESCRGRTGGCIPFSVFSLQKRNTRKALNTVPEHGANHRILKPANARICGGNGSHTVSSARPCEIARLRVPRGEGHSPEEYQPRVPRRGGRGVKRKRIVCGNSDLISIDTEEWQEVTAEGSPSSVSFAPCAASPKPGQL